MASNLKFSLVWENPRDLAEHPNWERVRGDDGGGGEGGQQEARGEGGGGKGVEGGEERREAQKL